MKKAFTLLELLIVVGILGILATVTFIVLTPTELLKQARDTRRVQELSTLNKVINWVQTSKSSISLGFSSVVYVSLPDTSDSCSNLSLPPLPSGWSYKCVTQANLKKVDGTGWIPINFTSSSFSSPLAALPIDPKNNASSSLYYTYVTGGSWELTALLESTEKHSPAINDGGRNVGVFEIGSNTGLTPSTRDLGLVGSWKFDEGNGITADDSSGNSNTGTLFNNPTWQSSTNCKSGVCLSFDGSDDYVDVGNKSSLDPTQEATIIVWVKFNQLPSAAGRHMAIATKSGTAADFDIQAQNNNDKFYFYVANGLNVISNTAIQTGQWYFVAATYKAYESLKMYINGSLENTTNISTARNTNSNSFQIAQSAVWGSRQLNGLIDEVRVYNRALSADEVKTLYDTTK